MALLFQRNEFSLECNSVSVTVPNNDIARLMYYLKSACAAIDCDHDQDIQRFINYNNWSYLSIDEQKALIVVCSAFSPDVLNDRVFFHSDALCRDSSNKFYKINQIRHQLLAAESIVIAGQVREVNQIMTYKMQWMTTYYYDPMKRLINRLGTSSQPTPYRPTYTPSVVYQPSSKPSFCKRNRGCICCCLCCIVFILPGVIAFIIGLFR